MMKVQKGLVKYKDRTDIVCNYGIVDGKQYYFINDGQLSNGNIIATITLVEAIDPTVAPKTLGVIDSEGNVVIPFENKIIRPINDRFLLVERSNPQSETVIASLSSRNDPLAATKLVTTAASIKDKINSKMGSEGRFIFNDQFSEAAIYDLDGNNIMNGEYYSFIGINDNNIYFSKNVVDFPVVEYAISENVKDEIADSKEEKADISEVVVSKLDNDLDEEKSEETKVSDQPVEDTKLDVGEVTVDSSQIEEAMSNAVEQETENTDPKEEVQEVSSQDVLDSIASQENIEDESTDQSDVSSIENEEVENTTNTDISTESDSLKDDSKDDSEFELPTVEPDSLVTDMEDKKDFDFPVDDKEIYNDSFDLDNKRDSYHETERHFDDYHNSINDSFDNDSYGINEGSDDVIPRVAVTMKRLIENNKMQRRKIVSINSENEELRDRIRNYENKISSLERENKTLNNEVRAKSRQIDNQRDEITALRRELKGKKRLAELLGDAEEILVDNDYEGSSYRKRAA